MRNDRRTDGAAAGNSARDGGQTQQPSRAGGEIAQIFDFEEYPVRIMIRGDGPWFCGSDVCRILALGNASQAIKGNEAAGAQGLDEDEWGVYNLDTSSAKGVKQERAMLFVSESGLYALIFKSRKAQAKKFRKWVTSQVLPAIRLEGRYALESAMRSSESGQLAELRRELLETAADAAARKMTAGQAQAVAITAARYLESLREMERGVLAVIMATCRRCQYE